MTRDRRRPRPAILRRSCAPSSMTTTRSDSCITRSSLCSISRMVMPVPLRPRMMLEHLGGLGRVHAGGRLVEQQQAGSQRERARDLQAPAVGVGEAERGIVGARNEALAEQRQDLHGLGAQRLPPRPAPRPAARAPAPAPRPDRSAATTAARRRAACARRPARCRARSGCRTRGRAGTCGRGRAAASRSAARPVIVAARRRRCCPASGEIEPGHEIEHAWSCRRRSGR